MNSLAKNCTFCSSVDTLRTMVSNNCLRCTCSKCGSRYNFPLLKLQKKIIYLDQNFFSHWYNNKEPKFIEIGECLHRLSRKQLIICPYSDAHDKETHLCLEKAPGLWDFIRAVSRGKRFYDREKILETQLINAYISFVRNEPPGYKMDLADAIESTVHDWDQSSRVDVSFSVTNFMPKNSLNDFKRQVTDLMIKALPQWRDSKNSLKQDYDLEIKDSAYILIGKFFKALKSTDFQAMLESEEFNMICMLLKLDVDKQQVIINEENEIVRLKQILSFVRSEHFKYIPNIDISSSLWALLKEEVKNKQFPTKNIERKVRGIAFDIEHLSIFAPYCEAIFTEKKMAGWLEKRKKCCAGNYAFEVFSAANCDDFKNYLDKIEKGMSSKMLDELEFAYKSNT